MFTRIITYKRLKHILKHNFDHQQLEDYKHGALLEAKVMNYEQLKKIAADDELMVLPSWEDLANNRSGPG